MKWVDPFPPRRFKKLLNQCRMGSPHALMGIQLNSIRLTQTRPSISLLLEKDKDSTSCGSYWPISLLNVDCKILAKVLSLCLQDVIPSIIYLDQTGFTLGRHSFFNTRRLLNLIFSPSPDTPEVIVSLDAEKAFDRVEWEYLFFALGKFEFDSKFISWIRLLYAFLSASVHTNGIRSPPFLLQRGTFQGCPLSPLLFNTRWVQISGHTYYQFI